MTLYRYLNAAGEAWQDSDGAPLAGGLLYFYLAGTTTPQATYTDSGGGTANSNPVVLNASGRIPNDVWLTGGISYKAELQDADGVTIQTWDNITGINDTTGLDAAQWVAGPDLTYVTGTTASASGDQTEVYQMGRRIWITSGAGETFGNIISSSYDAGTGLTTIGWDEDEGAPTVTNPVTAQSYGFLSVDNPSVPSLAAYAWLPSVPVTYASATTFTVSGDQTATFQVGRAVRCRDATTLYGQIAASSYSSPSTTVTVRLWSGSLSASLASVDVGLLEPGGNSALPSAGQWVVIESQEASSSATLDFTKGFDGEFDYYQLRISGLLPATDNVEFWIRVTVDGGSNWKAGASDYRWQNMSVAAGSVAGTQDTADSEMAVAGGVGNATNEGLRTAIVDVNDLENTQQPGFIFSGVQVSNNGFLIAATSWGQYIGTTDAVNGVRFLFSSGNIASGTITLLGLKVPA